ncbi:SDR family NAD(P)-dependent oxidoreductase [Nocardia carnea]|uniref:SDR family NAD(P)-dependent oxidoreductase n=1 Tax=Nocardia carnea TaxID=37328 RepID=UPI0024564D44|nr:SDR family NAD(P)-dependent oxidoreductase [Nocardia carnea]
MPIDMVDKRVIVTGGARGIGGESSRYFAKEGAHVVMFDINDDSGRQLAEEASASGPGSVTYRHLDVSRRNDIAPAVDTAVEILGGLDAVFNIAGIARSAPAAETPLSDWDDQFAVNVKGLSYVCEAAFPHLRDRGGSIVNFAADSALMDDPLLSASYSASKGAVISYTRTIAREWARFGIRANSVNPVVMTPNVEEFRSKMSPEERAQYAQEIDAQIPLGGQLGDIETDLAPVLLFLASDASRFITSQIIPVNGGLAYTR